MTMHNEPFERRPGVIIFHQPEDQGGSVAGGRQAEDVDPHPHESVHLDTQKYNESFGMAAGLALENAALAARQARTALAAERIVKGDDIPNAPK